VITLPHGEIERLRDLPEDQFNRQLTALYQARLGQMSLASPRCVYPLVGVWPDRLVAPGFAAIGDAAVGMHPVTAHGFNLGLASVESLAGRIQSACRSGQDFAADRLLAAYQAEHRRTSLPLYLATGAVVGLYTNNSLPASLLRRLALRSASRLAPFRRLIAGTLTDLGRAGS
jgi:2-polyprenyl-6-methoxyphenol hydroxylase-like FAD-dependent oxidoreductase